MGKIIGNFANILKIIFLKRKLLIILGFIAVWSCQDDDLENKSHDHSAQERIFKTVNLSDIPGLGNKLSNLKSKMPINGVNYKTAQDQVNYFDLIIPYNINSQIYDEANYLHHYTFALNLEETNTKTNLVVKETLSGEFKYYIFIFKPDNYQEWYNAIKNSDINYNKTTDFEAFEIQQTENIAYSSMCMEVTEVWTCPWRVHVLGEPGWGDCESFKSGGAGLNSWIRSYTYEMVFCGGMGGGGGETNPGNPSNPPSPGNIGGGKGNGAVAVPNLTNPSGFSGLENDDNIQEIHCQKMKDLTKTDSLNANIKAIISQLRSKTNFKKEWSCDFERTRVYDNNSPPEEDRYIYTTSKDERGVAEGISKNASKLQYGASFIGPIHTHPVDTDPMFSWTDLRALKKLYESAYDYNKQDVFIMIVCHDESVYSLKVDNFTFFNEKLTADLNKARGADEEIKRENIEETLKKYYGDNQSNLEKAFLKKYGNYGISLFKATDYNLTGWEKLQLNNERVDRIPCN